MKIYMHHVREAKMCAKGTRSFFEKQGLDFKEFLKNGMDAELFLKTGDAMALQVVEVAKNGRK